MNHVCIADVIINVHCHCVRTRFKQQTVERGWGVEALCLQARYRPGLPLVLRGLSFRIPSGTVCGVVGRTGSGKSSLLLALFNLIDIDGAGLCWMEWTWRGCRCGGYGGRLRSYHKILCCSQVCPLQSRDIYSMASWGGVKHEKVYAFATRTRALPVCTLKHVQRVCALCHCCITNHLTLLEFVTLWSPNANMHATGWNETGAK